MLSCKDTFTGSYIENKAPSTFLTVERINREGEFRLSSQINISWWGNDSDGYIIGYEYAINDTSEDAWKFTTKTDSTFILPITPGNAEDDVLFKIRAVDNDNTKDPVGARLIFPIVNSAPSVSLNQNETPPDTLYSISSFGWTISDPDGLANIQKTEVAVNDTVNGWVTIPMPEGEEQLFISLEVDNSATGTKTATVYQGRNFSTLASVQIENVEVGSSNTFYIRTTDAAGAISEMDSVSWFVKQQTSRTLFFNDFAGGSSTSRQNNHLNILEKQGITPDVWVINDGVINQGQVTLSEAFPTVIDPTLRKTLAKWDHVYWISNDLRRNINSAQEMLSDFYNKGGTSFINIPIGGVPQESDIFNLIPVDSIGAGSYLVLENEEVNPNPAILDSVFTMKIKSGSFALSNAAPIKPVVGGIELFNTNFQQRSANGGLREYNGYEGIAVENAEGTLIYIGLDISVLNGNNNVSDVIGELITNRLGFKQ